MKANILALITSVLLLTSCDSEKTQEGRAQEISTPPLSENYSVVIIDSCEYIQYFTTLTYAYAYSKSDYKAKFLTHKGNCKFCAERAAR